MNLVSKISCAVLLMVISAAGYAQDGVTATRCASAKKKLAARTSLADVAEDNYDMKYLKFNLVMDNTSTTLSGDVTTVAKVVSAAPLSAYVFELDPAYTIDSVLMNGVVTAVTGSGIVRTVALSTPLATGTLFTARVYYRDATTPGPTTFTGLTNLVSPSWGAHVTSTLSESYEAYEWWPCKQSLHDKIDSLDMWITVADTLKAGSNGLLKAITPIDATHVRYEWKERFPIDYYLISAAVAPYIDYSYYMHFTGSTDSMLVQNYVYNNPATLTNFKSVIDSTGMMIDYFSTLYGRYPFWKEKYGHCMAPIDGGMEHQTMTTLGFFEGSLVAHELGHQWFGDNVTCGTWGDIFMNEGFASYTEDLFIDHFRSHAKMITDIVSKQEDVKSFDTGTVYFTDTTSEGRIFDTRLSYDKGACLLHMLRFVVNNDSTFFQVYKTYQQQMKGGTGTIIDFRNTVVSVLGTTINNINIDSFFSQWAYLQGFPNYTVRWYQTDSDVHMTITQTTAVPSSVPMFTLPIEIKLHSAAGDTTVRILNNQSFQDYHINWPRSMLSMSVDPNNWLVYQLGSIIHDPALTVGNVAIAQMIIRPNPATNAWVAENVPANSTMTLMDITGRVLWTHEYSSAATTIPAGGLVPGMYVLRVENNEGEVTVYKLIKQ